MNREIFYYGPWKIYFIEYDPMTKEEIGRGVYHKSYKNYGNAYKIAYERYGDPTRFSYRIEHRDPWQEYTSTEHCDICKREYERPEEVSGRDAGCEVHLNNSQLPYRQGRWTRFMVCPDCYGRVKNFIESIKAVES